MSETSGTSGDARAGTPVLPADLPSAIEPALLEACDGKLTNLEWFRTQWQASGSATGYAQYETPDGPTDVVVKMPVDGREYAWTVALGVDVNGPTPHVLASGETLADHDLRWLVCERCPGQPISHDLTKKTVAAMLEATADWYVRAGKERAPVDPPDGPNWERLLTKAREYVRETRPEHAQRWNTAIHHVQRVLGPLTTTWDSRPITTWCHGDLHPGNAMRRASGGCLLLDLSLVHAGHWVEDAVYFERLFWGRHEKLGGLKPVKQLAKLLREREHPHGENHTALANARRVMMAACVPAFAAREWNPIYANAALELLERLLPMVAKH